MTATQPELGRASQSPFTDATELTNDPDEYFKAVERVNYKLDESAEQYISEQSGSKSYDDAAATLGAAFSKDESALAICNTIESARKLTERVQFNTAGATNVAAVYAKELERVGNVDAVDAVAVTERIEQEGDKAVLHLSTRLRPADRLTLIETAKELTDREYALVVVSTQLVEAGVDISFDRVYRDLAPIDSIVQAAGRCNRSFERNRGEVTVWWLDAPDESEKTPAEAIYNRRTSLLPVVAETLADIRAEVGTLTETAVARKAVPEYYRRLHEDKNVGKEAYAAYVDDANGEKLGELSLIDERRSAEVLVCRTQQERELAESIRSAEREHAFDRLRDRLDESKPLRVSVPYGREDSDTAEAVKELPQLVADRGIYQLNVRDRTSYFDTATGFVVPESTAGDRLL
jgi:CRISPR-associated endonuclease/helicase Cas3/CRISPR-associated endonuclease Cas3-HD